MFGSSVSTIVGIWFRFSRKGIKWSLANRSVCHFSFSMIVIANNVSMLCNGNSYTLICSVFWGLDLWSILKKKNQWLKPNLKYWFVHMGSESTSLGEPCDLDSQSLMCFFSVVVPHHLANLQSASELSWTEQRADRGRRGGGWMIGAHCSQLAVRLLRKINKLSSYNRPLVQGCWQKKLQRKRGGGEKSWNNIRFFFNLLFTDFWDFPRKASLEQLCVN